ncbi:thermonuclease family protein [Methanobrevibacter sp. YE315]|uniref:thermonuclease family protein n=1 Tax=Methanobrevibacter sp. YE315 TaxID=1609968 RepID=UPI00082E2C6A|nr:thermonuclease family protein [Methanobrevibacter sp. YE315]
MEFNKKHIISLLIILIIGLGVISIASAYTGTGFSHNIPFSKYHDLSNSEILNKYEDTDCHIERYGVCTQVVDGDTIYLDSGEKVRFVGVNTPERGVEGYIASKNFVQKFCLNKKIGLDVDDSKHSDKYGRTLAVVIVDGKNLNEMLLKEGLAEVMYIPPSEFYPFNWAGDSTHIPNSHTTYSNTQTDSDSGSGDSGSYIGNSNSGKFHKNTCKWGQKTAEHNRVYFNSRNDAISQGYQPCKVCNP